MRRALLLLTIIILFSSYTLAEGEAQHFFITETDTGIDIMPQVDIENTYVFVNNELVKEYNSIDVNETKSISFDRSQENEVELRYLKEYEYQWDNYNILKDDEVISLNYLKYDKDEKALKFSIDGENIIHPKDIAEQKKSVDASLSDYSVILDEEYTLNCYPKITTGQSTYFKCKTVNYPHIVDIVLTLGNNQSIIIAANSEAIVIEEEKEIVEEVAPEQIMEETVEETPKTLVDENDQEVITAPEETQVLDNIEMNDTILESKGMSNAVKFLSLMLFIALFALLFVASHHKHENRQAGHLHPHKRSKK